MTKGRVWQEGRKRGDPPLRGAPWYFVVDLAPPGAPRRQVKRRGFRTQSAARATLDELLVAVRSGDYVEPSKMSLGDYLEKWLDTLVVAGRRETTIIGYRRLLGRYVLRGDLATVPIQAISAIDLDRLYGRLAADGGLKGRPLSLRTVRYVHAVLGKALADAERKGLIARNPARLASPPATSATRAPEMTVWSPAELAVFLDQTEAHPHGVLFRLAALTGMRRGELCGLRWIDVDLEAGIVTVRRSVTSMDGQRIVGEVKSARSRRRIDIDPQTVSVLVSHRAGQARERLLMGEAYKSEGLVFAMADGQAWLADTISQASDRAVAASGLPRIRFHDLRHTHATHLLTVKENVKVVSDRLGHASVAFTLDTYGHVLPGQQASAAAVVAALIHGAP